MASKSKRGNEAVYATVTLKAALQTKTRREREALLDAFDHWAGEIERVNEVADPPSFAHSYHLELDERIDRLLAKSAAKTPPEIPSCRKGCAACCHLYVGIFPHEARLLRQAATAAGVEINEERLARQAQKTEDTWLELSPEDRRCVFLGEDRACQLYEFRPGGCRKYLVTSDPELCDADKYRNGKVSILYSLEAEVMQSAVMTALLPTLESGCDNMAALLLAVKDESQPERKFTCPRCERVSHNPNDIAQGYCGACHDWTAA